jgi:Mn-dependent DtxR family transcriptional regulator
MHDLACGLVELVSLMWYEWIASYYLKTHELVEKFFFKLEDIYMVSLMWYEWIASYYLKTHELVEKFKKKLEDIYKAVMDESQLRVR